jgi:hypothetical protein
MFKNPVLWADQNQITGDTIHLITNIETEKLDSIKVLNNAFINSKDSLSVADFNQIKGRNIFGKFKDNRIRTLLVKGNAESVYYNRNELGVLESISKEISSNIEFTLFNGEIETIKYLKATEGKTYPPSKLPDHVKELKGFVWREDEQPQKMTDIFIIDGENKKTTKATKKLGPISPMTSPKLDSTKELKGPISIEKQE